MKISLKILIILGIFYSGYKIYNPTVKKSVDPIRQTASVDTYQDWQSEEEIIYQDELDEETFTASEELPPNLNAEHINAISEDDELLAAKIAAFIEKRKAEAKEHKKQVKEELKEAMAEYKKMRQLEKHYNDLLDKYDERDNASKQNRDIIYATFGPQRKKTQLALSSTTQSSTNTDNPSSGETEFKETEIDEPVLAEITTWKDKSTFLFSEEPVNLFASINTNDFNSTLAVSAEIYSPDNQLIDTITYQNQGNYFQATFTPQSQNDLGNFLVKISINVGSTIFKTIDSFTINTRKISSNNNISYQIDSNKDLVFTTDWQVKLSGTYLFQASLYDINGNFITNTEIPLELTKGNQQVDLTFQGNTLYQKRISGGVVLKNIAISEIMPNLSSRGQELLTVDFATEDHNWQEFSTTPYRDPQVVRKIEQIQEALAL